MPLGGVIPASIENYTLSSRLGSGGMGVVFLGRSPSGRQVAVKVVHHKLAADPEFRARFRQEVAAARRVSGAFTAAVLDADPDADQPWMATQYVPGHTLSEQIKKHGPLSTGDLWRLAAGLAEALRDIHRAGVVHRDLKPSNVLLAADGPKVIDFGISRPLDSELRTETGKVIGTPPFMAPEQFRSPRAVGPAADVFALGCLLAHAALGRGPFDADSPYLVAYQIVHGDPDLSGVPAVLRPVVRCCLAKDPADRPAAGDLMAALGGVPSQDRPVTGRDRTWLDGWRPALGEAHSHRPAHRDATRQASGQPDDPAADGDRCPTQGHRAGREAWIGQDTWAALAGWAGQDGSGPALGDRPGTGPDPFGGSTEPGETPLASAAGEPGRVAPRPGPLDRLTAPAADTATPRCGEPAAGGDMAPAPPTGRVPEPAQGTASGSDASAATVADGAAVDDPVDRPVRDDRRHPRTPVRAAHRMVLRTLAALLVAVATAAGSQQLHVDTAGADRERGTDPGGRATNPPPARPRGHEGNRKGSSQGGAGPPAVGWEQRVAADGAAKNQVSTAKCTAVDTALYCSGAGISAARIDTAAGRVRWSRPAGATETRAQTPVVSGGLVQVIQVNERLDALDPGTGRTRWSTGLGGYDGCCTFAGDIVLLSTKSGVVTALDGATGAQRWHRHIPGHPRPALAYLDGTAYATTLSDDGSQTLVSAIRPGTGTVLWKQRFAGNVSLAAASDGSLDLLRYDTGDLSAIDAVIRYTPATGTISRTPLPYPVQAPTAVAQGAMVYLLEVDGTLLAVDSRQTRADRAVRWQTETAVSNPSPASLSGDRLYFSASDGRILSVDLYTEQLAGQTKPRLDPRRKGVLVEQPAPIVAGERIYAATPRGSVFSVDAKELEPWNGTQR